MSRRSMYLFWGLMDLLYVARFTYLSLSQGKIPLYSDWQSFTELVAQQGGLSAQLALVFGLSLTLTISILFSALMFLGDSRYVPVLVYIQTPFRLFFVVPSLFFLSWLMAISGETSAFVFLGLLMFSEVLKVSSVVFRSRLFAG